MPGVVPHAAVKGCYLKSETAGRRFPIRELSAPGGATIALMARMRGALAAAAQAYRLKNPKKIGRSGTFRAGAGTISDLPAQSPGGSVAAG